MTRSCRTKFCRLSTRLLPTLLAVLAVGGLLFGAQPASAQGTCIQDVWKAHGNNQNLTCTAKDVTLSDATNINIINGGECVIENGERVCRCFAGQTVTFTAEFRMDLTAETRYDVGFYLATDGDTSLQGALTGQCSATASLASNTPAGNFINLDAAPDVCGDITGPLGTAHNPLHVTAQTSAQCPATPGQQLVVPWCTTWRQPGSNQVCLGTGNGTTTNDVYPGSPSKCNCNTLALDIFSETVSITVTKDALTPSVPETGGSATYSVKVKNNNNSTPLTLTSLTDDQYGDITQVQGEVTATTCVPDGNTATCEVGGSIAPGAECSCTFTANVPPGDFPGSFTDVVTGCGTNIFTPAPICDDDDATVPYTDVQQPPSLTKTVGNTQCQIDVTYNVVVTNSSAQDTLTLSALNDDVYGDITSVHGNVISTTCGLSGTGNPGALPFVIATSGNYSCSFVGRITSCDTTVHDTVTAKARDDDGKDYTPSDDANVVVKVTTP
jgi:hypothetical protein